MDEIEFKIGDRVDTGKFGPGKIIDKEGNRFGIMPDDFKKNGIPEGYLYSKTIKPAWYQTRKVKDGTVYFWPGELKLIN